MKPHFVIMAILLSSAFSKSAIAEQPIFDEMPRWMEDGVFKFFKSIAWSESSSMVLVPLVMNYPRPFTFSTSKVCTLGKMDPNDG